MSATYDGFGNRNSKTNSSGTTYYVGGLEISGASNSSPGYISAINEQSPFGLAGRMQPPNSSVTDYQYTFDPQGNPAQRFASTGAVDNYMFDAFGERVSSDTSGDPNGYFGSKWGYYGDPEVGLEHVGARYYDPEAGRFLTRDPLGAAGGSNPYAYADNNPINAIDPLGLYC